MDTTLFSQINTSIAVRDSQLIDPDQFVKIRQTTDFSALSLLLQGTSYSLTPDELSQLDCIDKQLLAVLVADYEWAFSESPDTRVVDFFALPYFYHNLKVLLKARATKSDLSHLLIPIGSESLETVDHLVTSLSSEYYSSAVVSEVESIWSEYVDYQDIRVIDIGCDLAYFKALRSLAEDLDAPEFRQSALLQIDFYNVTTILRAKALHKPQSFIWQLLSDEGSLTAKEVFNLVSEGNLDSWLSSVVPDDLSQLSPSLEVAIKEGNPTSQQLETLHDMLQYRLFDVGRYEVEGPLVLARYLLGREYEVKNLRLILSGKANHLPIERLIERERPIYGQ